MPLELKLVKLAIPIPARSIVSIAGVNAEVKPSVAQSFRISIVVITVS